MCMIYLLHYFEREFNLFCRYVLRTIKWIFPLGKEHRLSKTQALTSRKEVLGSVFLLPLLFWS